MGNEIKEIVPPHSIGQSASSLAKESMASFRTWLNALLTWEHLLKAIGAIIVILLLWGIYRLVKRAIRRIPPEKMPQQQSVLILKFTKYAFYIIVIMCVLSLFGIRLSAVLGAAGIAGVAIGFAAQTSMSNLISGIFALSEHVIKIGDAITVGDVTGVVDSIDSLSVKVHTFDNQLVRIPNSTIIDSKLVNLTYYPVRRFTFSVSVSYDTDMRRALDILLEAPKQCPTVISEPAPTAWFDGFSANGIAMILAVWFKTEDLRQTKNDCFIAIKKVFDDAGISIPYSRIEVHFVDDIPLQN